MPRGGGKGKMRQVDETARIDDECLPVRANLKVVRRNDPDFGLSEEEIQDRNEFIRCYIMREFELLLSIPKPEPENDFFIENFQESAFNTYDFQNQHRPFNKHAYAKRKVMESIRDLAILHSCISHEAGRMNVRKTYESVVYDEFRGRLLWFVEQHRKAWSKQRKAWLKKKVAELNQGIIECKEVWESYAPPELWDA